MVDRYSIMTVGSEILDKFRLETKLLNIDFSIEFFLRCYSPNQSKFYIKHHFPEITPSTFSEVKIQTLVVETSLEKVNLDFFPGVETIYFKYSHLLESADLSKLHNLKHIFLGKGDLELLDFNNIPKQIDQIEVVETRIKRIKTGRGGRELRVLKIQGANLEQIPSGISQYSNLEELEVSNSSVSTVAIGFGNLSNLKILNLANNNIRSIQLDNPNLVELNISWNAISELDLQKTPNLIRVNLAHNDLISYPDGIIALLKLKKLILAGNELKKIPYELNNWSSLNHLDLCQCDIGIIPPTIKKLTKLKSLYLASNMIEDVDTLTKLPKLQTLLLANNNITTIPKSLLSMKNLTEVNLYANSIIDVPIDLEVNESGECTYQSLKIYLFKKDRIRLHKDSNLFTTFSLQTTAKSKELCCRCNHEVLSPRVMFKNRRDETRYIHLMCLGNSQSYQIIERYTNKAIPLLFKKSTLKANKNYSLNFLKTIDCEF
ncbi:MAG: leucine-rich repeat domain-containing protein [Candidatus Heimdallarchaeota archaeon]|nr:leucine-rich repeat domain-containing protein [Candidatus Heimdallarchaeota archaeon]